MKKLYILLMLVTCTSCGSDQLSNSNAKDIIKDCLALNPKRVTSTIHYGERTIYKRDKEEFENLKLLEDKGLLQIDSVGTKTLRYYGTYVMYNIQLTEKAKEFISSQREVKENKYADVILYEFEVADVKEVHEIPSMNMANVRAEFRRVNVTPFNDDENEKISDFKIENLDFAKTSNGWRYCKD